MKYQFKKDLILLESSLGNIDRIMKFHTFMLSKFKWECNDLTEITRGSKGREVSVGETMLGCFHNNTCNRLPVALLDVVQSSSSHVDILKYGFNDAFGINERKLVSTLGAALMNKSIYGEKTA